LDRQPLVNPEAVFLSLDLLEAGTDNDRMEGAVKRIGSFFVDTIETVVIALSIFLVVYLFLMQPHQVDGISMFPNFHDKDYILTDKVSYRFGDPKRGDVVVFHAPPRADCPKDTACDFIKRVIALPGDSIRIQSGAYYVNDAKLPESYIASDVFTRGARFLGENVTYTLKENEYFVTGDNRPHSSDSREWGPISKQEIVGRGFLRYWPLNRLGFLPKATYPF
jgi:signal peptidase I